MIYDLELQNQKPLLSDYDICICGAGAAGITLAKELAKKGMKIVLLEGGGRDYSQSSQSMYKGRSVGIQYYLDLWRLRFLGGTTNHWSGRCRPFEKVDFEERNYEGLPGWPISFDDIASYLPEAKEILGLPASNTFKALPSTKIESNKFEADKFYDSDPVRFGQKYYDLLAKSENIDLFLNANVTDIQLYDDLQTVEAVIVRNYSGSTAKVRAKKFILCMGAIETARILLNSNSQVVEGIGNQTDMVGRCFMEHFNIDLGSFVADTKKWQDFSHMQFFSQPDYVLKNKLAMSSIAFGKMGSYEAYGRTAELKKIFNDLSCRLGVSEHLQFIYKHKCLGEGVIGTICEQFPYKESRISLDSQEDTLGLKRIKIDWKMSPANASAIREIAIDMAKEYAKNDLGRVKLKSYIWNANEPIPAGAHAHQMGTTRMAESHEHGVVDQNCRVFATKNLYVAGSGVFASGGGGNPTMPIIQLTLRLASHLS